VIGHGACSGTDRAMGRTKLITAGPHPATAKLFFFERNVMDVMTIRLMCAGIDKASPINGVVHKIVVFRSESDNTNLLHKCTKNDAKLFEPGKAYKILISDYE